MSRSGIARLDASHGHDNNPSTVTGATQDSEPGAANGRHTLRLPSFATLGIANPHSYKPRLVNGAFGDSSDTTNDQCIGRSGTSTSHAILAHPLSTLTPPSDSHDILWDSAASVLGSVSQSMADRLLVPDADDNLLTPGLTPRQTPSPESAELWLNEALDSLMSDHKPPERSNRTFKVLSHALPFPSEDGSVFKRVMSALYEHSITSSTSWINVFHALPGRFTLTDLPTSPPATPGQPLQGEDYFTQKVFDSAIAVADYHTDLSALCHSPRPAVPPGSVDIAIVERYIPPPTELEFKFMFDTTHPSVLVDRLVELSSDNGRLLFIYPTRAGAQTFASHYLAPILDPLIRTLATVHSLPTALCGSIGHLPVADKLLSHEEMAIGFTNLCARLSEQPSRYSDSSQYCVVHASTAHLVLDRQVWAREWWLKQEKERIRFEVAKWSRSKARPARDSMLDPGEPPATAADLLRQLVDGIERRPYPMGCEPSAGVEVSVFVVQRS